MELGDEGLDAFGVPTSPLSSASAGVTAMANAAAAIANMCLSFFIGLTLYMQNIVKSKHFTVIS